MSSFIVESKTITRILSFLISDGGSYDIRMLFEEIEKELGHKGVQEIGQAMLDLNCQTVAYRYSEKRKKLTYEFDYTFLAPSIYQALKSLRCWLYQCSEGSIPENSKLYQKFSEYADCLSYRIVNSLPEYEKAEWA